MKIKLRTFLTISILLCAVWLAAQRMWVGLSYVIACLPLIVFSSPKLVSGRMERLVLIFTCLLLGGGYLVRPLFLVAHPSYFKFPEAGAVTGSDHVEALLALSIHFSFILLGLWICIHLGRTPLRLPIKEDLTERAQQGLLVRLRWLIIVGATVLLFVQIGTAFAAETRAGSGSFSMVEAWFRVLPYPFVIPMLLVYVIGFRETLSRIQRLACAGAVTIGVIGLLIEGHKAFLISVLFGAAFVGMARRPDLRIDIRLATVAMLTLALATIIGFPLAQSIRGGGVSNVLMSMNATAERLGTDEARTAIVNMISGRIGGGYDGVIAAGKYQPQQAIKIFSEANILRRAVDKLIPGWTTTGPSMGKVVSVYYQGYPWTMGHAGALGLFGSLMLTGVSWVYALLIGCTFGVIFRSVLVTHRIKRIGKVLLIYVFIYLLGSWIISGNLDNNIQSLLVLGFHVAFYGTLLLLVDGATKGGVRRVS